MKRIFYIILVAFFAIILCAEDDYETQAGAFLRIPVGARPAGMGNAFVAVADDANADFWNPGGLYQIETTTIGGMYNIMSLDRHHYEGSIIYPYTKSGTFAVMFNNFGVSDIDGRDIDGNQTETFSDNEMAFSVGYCHVLPNEIGLGANFKYLVHSLQDNKATGTGFDMGVHKKFGAVSLGGSISNIGAKLVWDTDSDLEEEIPTTARFGAAYLMNISNNNLLISGEMTKIAGEKESTMHLGAELTLMKMLLLRGGLDHEDFNFGFSIKVSKFMVDYAMVSDFLDEGATNKIGIQIKF